MCKSSSLAFVLLFAFAFKLERPTWTLAGVIGVICVGLFMMVMSEVDFVLIGYGVILQTKHSNDSEYCKTNGVFLMFPIGSFK